MTEKSNNAEKQNSLLFCNPANELLIQVLTKCWSAVQGTYLEATLLSNKGIRYAAARDMANILRAILPPSVVMAAAAKPEWNKNDSPLAVVAARFALCLGSRETGLDILADGFAPLLASKEEAEAFAVFSAAFTLNLLLYMLCVPHLANSVSELYPDISERAIAALSQAASWNTAKGPFKKLKRWLRKKELEKSVGVGALPESEWVVKFIQQHAARSIWDILDGLINKGVLLNEQPKESEKKEVQQ